MAALNHWLKTLQAAAKAFFHHDLALRRDGGALSIVLEESHRRQPHQRPTGIARLDQKSREELALMQAELAQVLDEVPETRAALRHLGFVEQELGKSGLQALNKLPLALLQHALGQLDGLVTNWSPKGLANLRSKMAVALIEREQSGQDDETEAEVFRTTALMDAEFTDDGVGVEVTERAESDAIAAAYAALGTAAPSEVRTQAELGAQSTRKASRASHADHAPLADITLRELQ